MGGKRREASCRRLQAICHHQRYFRGPKGPKSQAASARKCTEMIPWRERRTCCLTLGHRHVGWSRLFEVKKLSTEAFPSDIDTVTPKPVPAKHGPLNIPTYLWSLNLRKPVPYPRRYTHLATGSCLDSYQRLTVKKAQTPLLSTTSDLNWSSRAP